jgi:hypothetical protein
MKNNLKEEAANVYNTLDFNSQLWLGLMEQQGDESVAYISDSIAEPVFISTELYDSISSAESLGYREAEGFEEWKYDGADVMQLLQQLQKPAKPLATA